MTDGICAGKKKVYYVKEDRKALSERRELLTYFLGNFYFV
jgi:hypothetical protein